jgi:hypothetical protein
VTQRRQKHIYFLGFLLVFAICLVLMLRYKNLILKNKKKYYFKIFQNKKKNFEIQINIKA